MINNHALPEFVVKGQMDAFENMVILWGQTHKDWLQAAILDRRSNFEL
jgi:hypothetical protein